MSDDELQKRTSDELEPESGMDAEIEAADERAEELADRADEEVDSIDEPVVERTEALDEVAVEQSETLETIADNTEATNAEHAESVPAATRNMFSDDAEAYQPTDEEVRIARRRALKLGLIGGAAMSVIMVICVILLILLVRTTS